MAGLALDTVTESAGEMGLLGGGAIFLGVLLSDLVIEREGLKGFDASLALVINRLGVVGLVEIAFGRMVILDLVGGVLGEGTPGIVDTKPLRRLVFGPGMRTPGVLGEGPLAS